MMRTFAFFGMAACVYGVERHVPTEYQTIQQAIFASQAGDEVVIAPGTYSGTNNWNLDTFGLEITIRSSDPTNPTVVASTVIDCMNTSNFGIRFVNDETQTTILDGITIRRSQVPVTCGASPIIRHSRIVDCMGFVIISGSPVVEDCTFESNTSSRGAVHVIGGPVDFTGCRFIANHSVGSGGAINIETSSATETSLINCRFVDNTARDNGGAVYLINGSLISINSLYWGNSASIGGALYHVWQLSQISLLNNTFVSNLAFQRGGALYLDDNNAGNEVINSVLWANDSPLGPQVAVGPNGFALVDYCTIDGGQPDAYIASGGFVNWTINNISQDPMFIGSGDFHLQSNSPAIDSGNNNALPLEITTDLDGSPRFLDDTGSPDTGNGIPPIVDMGVFEFAGMSSQNDEDNDGVPDSNDVCLGTIPGVAIDASGCPPRIKGDIDRDGDVDQDDFAILQLCTSGPFVPADSSCYE